MPESCGSCSPRASCCRWLRQDSGWRWRIGCRTWYCGNFSRKRRSGRLRTGRCWRTRWGWLFSPAFVSDWRRRFRGTKPAGRRMRLRSILLAAEVAMTVMLLVGASLLTKAVARSRSLDPGFSVADVTLVSLEFPAGAYDADAFHSRLEERLNAAADLPSFGLAEREPLQRPLQHGRRNALRLDRSPVGVAGLLRRIEDSDRDRAQSEPRRRKAQGHSGQ